MNTPSTTASSTISPGAISSRCATPSLASGQDRRSTRAADRPGQAEWAAQSDPFAQRFGKSLPRELRIEADQMSWPAFESAYAPTAGPLRLSAWSEERINSARTKYTATLGIEHAVRLASTDASGPISAMTAILHEAGFPMEVTSFHQQQAGRQIATFIYCTNGARRHWAMGIGENCTDSILHAFISAANLLGGA